ncbi:ABC transporter permease [Oribacterium sp. WCC10]|uniref:ABC transporter permease n=1 Tax=Oribacterium sp. WCC10 TaxID=1855343 RepID=UPI0008E30EE6|nr:ABC transporter permease [Oribacterium sp. WCC10]SFG56925.1 ABC-type transport system, involved in lipoprotein release, permease component [Oribacterium sp. WCC10]
MKLSDLFKLAVSNLRRRKTRTLLTVLGVVIGTASIVVMVSLGLGMSQMMLQSFQDEGSLTMIRVYESYDRGDSGKAKDKQKTELTDDNIAMFGTIDHVVAVSPSLEVNVSAKCNGYEGGFTICGVSQYYLSQLKLREGGKIPGHDQNELSLVYGNQILYNSFYKPSNYDTYTVNPDKDTIFITFPTSSYSEKPTKTDSESSKPKEPKKYVIPASGIIAGGENDWSSYSYNVYADLDTFKRFLRKLYKKALVPDPRTRKNGKAYNYYVYDAAYVFVDDMDNVQTVQEQISNLGFNVSSNMEWLQSAQEQLGMVQMVLGGIGGVSLLVAAIGIMNTMMMSIYERTKEIGVMKVLGCDMSDIRNMFLFESGIIGFLGGIAGIIVSYIISFVINFFTSSGGDDTMSMFFGYGEGGSLSFIPVWLAAFAIVFAIAVGSLAGYVPAVRAMKLSPLAAIRNE